MTANNAFAQKRLQKEGIYCLHTKHINLCGGIDVVAFDKVEVYVIVIVIIVTPNKVCIIVIDLKASSHVCFGM